MPVFAAVKSFLVYMVICNAVCIIDVNSIPLLFLQDEVACSDVVYVKTTSTPAQNDPVELPQYVNSNDKQTWKQDVFLLNLRIHIHRV